MDHSLELHRQHSKAIQKAFIELLKIVHAAPKDTRIALSILSENGKIKESKQEYLQVQPYSWTDMTWDSEDTI